MVGHVPEWSEFSLVCVCLRARVFRVRVCKSMQENICTLMYVCNVCIHVSLKVRSVRFRFYDEWTNGALENISQRNSLLASYKCKVNTRKCFEFERSSEKFCSKYLRVVHFKRKRQYKRT